MPDRTLDRLSFLDTSFLALEAPNTHMHVGSVAVFDGNGLTDSNGRLDIARVKQMLAARLHFIPRYRQRLAWIPIENAPVWIDDAQFDLEYHIRHTSLPAPGGVEQLKALAGRVMSNNLDRSKPLWELWFVEGLEDESFGMISKIHHCMIDGMSGVDLMTVLLGMVPDANVGEPKPWSPRPEPTGAELLVGDVAMRARAALDRMTSARQLREKGQEVVAGAIRRTSAVGASLGSGWLRKGVENPLNQPIGPNRRITWTDTSLADIKAIKNGLGGSVNDAVLSVVAGTVRKFLTEHRQTSVEGVEYRIMAPVSVRKKSAVGTLGNQVAMWLVNLPIGEPDPARRHAAVSETTRHLKRSDQALGASTLVQLSAGAPITLISLGARLAAGRRPFNTTVTNVPGPQIPLYMLESELVNQYPIVPLWQNHGYGIAVFSYNGTMAWGINSDWDLLPDNEAFVDCLGASVDELKTAAGAS